MAHALRRGIGSIGVGGLAEVANQVSRSYRQAVQALRVRTGSVDPHGVTIDDDMGIYQGNKQNFALFLGRLSPAKGLPHAIAAACSGCTS